MKIAYVIINANRHEGTSRAVVEVAERLAAEHEVHLWARRIEHVDTERVACHQVGGAGWPSVVDLASFVRRADRQLRHGDYDIVHSAGVNTTLADVYTIQTIQIEKRKAMLGVDAHQNAGWLRRWTRGMYDQRVIAGEQACYTTRGPRGVRAFAPVAGGTRDELLRHYPVVDAELAIIPNAADIDRFHPRRRAGARPRILQRHGLQGDDIVLLFSGGEWRRKGLDLAIESLRHLPQANVKLLVAGADPVGSELRQLPHRLDLADRVVFAGFVDDIEDYYAASDLLLFPTAYEAFSLATIEATASGLPVLMCDVSGAAELVGSGEAGSIIPRDPAGIAAVVQQLIDQPDELARLRQGARALCERCYSWDQVADQTLQLYERLLARRRSEGLAS